MHILQTSLAELVSAGAGDKYQRYEGAESQQAKPLQKTLGGSWRGTLVVIVRGISRRLGSGLVCWFAGGAGENGVSTHLVLGV